MKGSIYRRLEELFEALSITPNPGQIDQFAKDLATLNQPYLSETLLSLLNSKGLRESIPKDYRNLILSVYYRKTAAANRIFPYLFVFESGFRSLAATELEDHHGSIKWWRPIEADLRRRDPKKH